MKRKYPTILLAFLLILVLISCKTYYIPVESFKKQFSGIDSSKFVTVRTQGPFGMIKSYQSNPINNIECLDSKKNPHTLIKSPSLEIRFTDKNNRKYVYYFDRIFLKDGNVEGVQSRIITAIRHSLPIENVTKIEIQDGHKNYRYIK